MADSTTPAYPSRDTRRMIQRAWLQARNASNSVNRYAGLTRRAVGMFDADFGELADDDYAALVESSGLGRLIDAATRMQATLDSIASRDAA